MVYFPNETFRHITSYMLDPYKKDREAHAAVWQSIRVQRWVHTQSIVHEDDFEEEHNGEYFVYSPSGKSASATVLSTKFIEGLTSQSGEWDNVFQECALYSPDGSCYATTEEDHNVVDP